MTLGNNFTKDQPSKGSSFTEDKPSKGSSFVEDKPAKGSSFAEDKPNKGSSLVEDKVAIDNHVWDGDNVTSDPYGGDFATYGEVYGQGQYGGFRHFLNRTPITPTH